MARKISLKKLLIILGLAFAVPVLLIITARLTGIYGFYKIPTTNMYPTLQIGQLIFTSNIPEYKKGNIVVYRDISNFEDPTSEKDIFMCRIVAHAGDTLEMRNGFLFINKKLADDTLKLGFHFKAAQSDVNNNIREYEELNLVQTGLSDSLWLNVSYADIRKLGLENKAIRLVSNYGMIKPSKFNIQKDSLWSADNFGPVIIPKDYYFLMGDNRSNSLDSRYRGFVSKDQLVAKVLNAE